MLPAPVLARGKLALRNKLANELGTGTVPNSSLMSSVWLLHNFELAEVRVKLHFSLFRLGLKLHMFVLL